MKRFIWITGMALVLSACGNNNGKQGDAGTDSGTHSNHQSGDSNHSSHNAGAGVQGRSMMELMQMNMDQMKNVSSTGNPDNDFAALMKIHHMGAIEMAQLQLAKGTDAELRAMAQKILNDQQKEVAQLNTFLSGHAAHGGGDTYYKEVMAKMNAMNMNMDHTGTVDQQFARMMIPHHQSGIDMAQAYLKSGAHEEELKTMANAIITEQRKEISQLQAWLDKNK